jgi:8-hydroxy-5-deazaflavin:NADPH oxidoreductase
LTETTQATTEQRTDDRGADAPVAIIGASGALGFGLAVRLARERVPVVIGSRSAERAEETVRRARGLIPSGSFAGATNAEATAAAAVVVLSVPFASQAEMLSGIAPALRPGQVLVDATVPLASAVGGRPTRTVGVWHGSAAQQAQDLVPAGIGVVSALHTVSAEHLTDLQYHLDEHVLMCGDGREDKQRVARLLERVPGLQCIDCGRLEMARLTEQLTPLLISINRRYKTHAGIKVTGLPPQSTR